MDPTDLRKLEREKNIENDERVGSRERKRIKLEEERKKPDPNIGIPMLKGFSIALMAFIIIWFLLSYFIFLGEMKGFDKIF